MDILEPIREKIRKKLISAKLPVKYNILYDNNIYLHEWPFGSDFHGDTLCDDLTIWKLRHFVRGFFGFEYFSLEIFCGKWSGLFLFLRYYTINIDRNLLIFRFFYY